MPNRSSTSEKKRGNAFAFAFFKVIISLFGLRGAYLFLHPVCLHYLLFDRAAVKAALPYIRRRFPDEGFLKHRFRIWRLFVNQGKQLIDRFAALSGKVAFNFTLHGVQEAKALINGSSTGVVLLTSHVGNWQLAMSALGQLEKTVYLVMLPEYNEAVRDALKMRREQEQIKFISSAGHLGGVVDIMNVLKRGDMVSIMGDRTENFEGASVPFLGDQARLPYGPFQIAATARCPVLFLFSSKTGLKDYRIDLSQAVTPVLTDRKSRREKLQGWVADYARRLEAYTETFPMQCFIFRDLWENSPVE